MKETSETNSTEANTHYRDRDQFDVEFLDLQNPRSSSGRLIYVFVKRTLWNFGLSGRYSEACILNEAYIRGVRSIDRGDQIRNPPAWLRQTAYNIIRELSREHAKTAPLEEEGLEHEEIATSLLVETVKDDIEVLKLAFQMLEPQDRKLLTLKIVDGLSWRQIRERLRLLGEGDYAEDILRKRKERALIRLRKKFHALKPSF